MSGAHTPPRARIASQMSSTGTIASENNFFKDELRGRGFLVSFHHFSHAFLWSDHDDLVKSFQYQYLPGFQEPYEKFYQRTTGLETADVYTPLVQLMNFIVHSERTKHGIPDAVGLHFTSSTSTQGIKGSTGIRKPDICGLQSPGDVTPVTWNIVSVACEYKRRGETFPDNLPTAHYSSSGGLSHSSFPQLSGSSVAPHGRSRNSGRSAHSARPPRSSSQRASPAPPIERDLQLSRYLLEMRSHQATRESVLGILFIGSLAAFWYADSDTTIKSDFISINSVEFISALICLARANPEKLGYSPHFRAQDDSIITSQPINTARFIGEEISRHTTTYKLDDLISLARALHGRCSRVIGATLPGIEEPCVLKLSYQVVSRDNEAVLIKRAQDRGVTGLVRLHRFFTLRKLSEGPRSRLPANTTNHLLLEDRELRVLVLARCTPLYCISDPYQFLSASISLLNTICDLYETGQILHRDISVNNLMVESSNPSAGVLIDLDHAVDFRENGKKNTSSLHRTGTLPFMALDLLHDDQNYRQHLRHDLESFVYVLFWIASRYESGREVNKLTFDDWCEGTWNKISGAKYNFLVRRPPYHSFKPSPGFDFLSNEIAIFRQLLGKAHSEAVDSSGATSTVTPLPMRPRRQPTASTPYPDDLDGVNRDNFLSILNNALDRLSDPPPGSSASA